MGTGNEEDVIEFDQLVIRDIDEFTVWIEDEWGDGVQVDKKVLEPYILRCVREQMQ